MFTTHLTERGRELPEYVHREFDDYPKCGRFENGFLRVRCESCHAVHLVAFRCKRRGFCPSCGARRMAESSTLLVDEVFLEQPVRQWVLSVPFPLRFLFASRPDVMGRVLGIVYRTIATHLVKKAGQNHKTARTGAVTLIQRFGSAPNLNIHFYMLFLDGVFAPNSKRREFITPAKRGRGSKSSVSAEPTTLAEQRASMTWAQRLKRVFHIDIETCVECGGPVMESNPLAESRAPPCLHANEPVQLTLEKINDSTQLL